MNMSLEQKTALEDLVKAGKKVASVIYDPTLIGGSSAPEIAATSAGWILFQREDTPNLIEVVYTK